MLIVQKVQNLENTFFDVEIISLLNVFHVEHFLHHLLHHDQLVHEVNGRRRTAWLVIV